MRTIKKVADRNKKKYPHLKDNVNKAAEEIRQDYFKGKKKKSPAKQKDFNKTGSKASTTPGYSTTKAAKSNMKAKTNMAIDFNYENKKAQGQKLAKVTKKPKLPKNFNATGSSKAGKFAKVAKKVVGKGGKFLGGKLLGVAGMMMATSSKADQPTKGKGKREYPGGKIDFTKKK